MFSYDMNVFANVIRNYLINKMLRVKIWNKVVLKVSNDLSHMLSKSRWRSFKLNFYGFKSVL